MRLFYRRRWHYGNGDRNLLRGTWAETHLWTRADLPAILAIGYDQPAFVGYETLTSDGVVVSFTRRGSGVFPRRSDRTPIPWNRQP